MQQVRFAAFPTSFSEIWYVILHLDSPFGLGNSLAPSQKRSRSATGVGNKKVPLEDSSKPAPRAGTGVSPQTASGRQIIHSFASHVDQGEAP